MDVNKRIAVFVQLGKLLGSFGENLPWPGYECGLNEGEYDEFNARIQVAKHYNGWFTEKSVRSALSAWGNSLTAEGLDEWLTPYRAELETGLPARSIGLILAGNIPMVGFHDMLTALLAGHHVKAKLSGQDDQLMTGVAVIIKALSPELGERIELVEAKLEGFDAVIATGSNNSARYFEAYFGKYPNVIRKNRTSVAILQGDEEEEELKKLADDIFLYFGLGCRNVSKLYLPKGYDLDRIFNALYNWKELIDHKKFANNYDYHKALFLMNQDAVLENGFVIMKEDAQLVSPVGTIYYEYYEDEADLRESLSNQVGQIQCLVSKKDTPFGSAQQPQLWDYADGVDTMRFLLDL